jgi:hypothetical protein
MKLLVILMLKECRPPPVAQARFPGSLVCRLPSSRGEASAGGRIRRHLYASQRAEAIAIVRAVHVCCEVLHGELRTTNTLGRLQERRRLHVLILICILLRILRQHCTRIGWISPPSSRPIGEPPADRRLVWAHSSTKPLSKVVSETLTWTSLEPPLATICAAAPSSITPVTHLESLIIVLVHKI